MPIDVIPSQAYCLTRTAANVDHQSEVGVEVIILVLIGEDPPQLLHRVHLLDRLGLRQRVHDIEQVVGQQTPPCGEAGETLGDAEQVIAMDGAG